MHRLLQPSSVASAVTALVAVICGVFGLVIGSFLNVVIWRVPRKESIVARASHCPVCDTPIAPRDNIPVVSWLLLARPVPALRRADLVRGIRSSSCSPACCSPRSVRGSPTRGRCPAYLVLTAALDRDLGDRPRALHPPEPHRVPARASRASSCSRSRRRWSTTGARSAGRCSAARGRVRVLLRPARRLAARHGLRRRAAVVRARSVPRLARLGARCSAGLFAGFLYGAVVGVVVIAVGGRGPQAAHPVRAVPGGRHDDLRALRRPDRRLVPRPRALTRAALRRAPLDVTFTATSRQSRVTD